MYSTYHSILRNLSCLDRGQTVADLACGSGFVGRECLKMGYEKVVFVDARDERFIKPTQTNWEFHKKDLTKDDVLDVIKECDILLCMNYFYHATDIHKVLDAFSKTNCKHLLINSKCNIEFLNSDPHIEEGLEYTSKNTLAYDDQEVEISVYKPNTSYMKNALIGLGFDIVYVETTPIFTKVEGHYFIHAKRD